MNATTINVLLYFPVMNKKEMCLTHRVIIKILKLRNGLKNLCLSMSWSILQKVQILKIVIFQSLTNLIHEWQNTNRSCHKLFYSAPSTSFCNMQGLKNTK